MRGPGDGVYTIANATTSSRLNRRLRHFGETVGSELDSISAEPGRGQHRTVVLGRSKGGGSPAKDNRRRISLQPIFLHHGKGGRMAEWYWMGRQLLYCCRFESRTPRRREGGHAAVMLCGV